MTDFLSISKRYISTSIITFIWIPSTMIRKLVISFLEYLQFLFTHNFSVMFLFIQFYLFYYQFVIDILQRYGPLINMRDIRKYILLNILIYNQNIKYSPIIITNRIRMKALKETIFLGIFFLIIVTTYSSFSLIVTYMYQNKKDGLHIMGPVLLFVNFFSFLVSNSFAPSIRISLTSQMKIAAFCYTINYLSEAFQMPGSWGIFFSCFGAIVGGYGAALLWVCYGAYMKNLQIQGKYFSILNGITFGSFLLGSVITTYCLQFFSDQIYFFILSGLGAFSLLFCWIFIKPIAHRHDLDQQIHHWCSQIKRNFKYYKKMKAIIPTLVYDGLLLGFISTSSTNLMPKDSQKYQIGVFLIFLGVGCIFGGFLSGQLSDYLTMKSAGKLSIVIILWVSILTSFSLYFSNKPIAYVLGFLWGVSRQYIQGWLYVACSRNYNGRLQSYANMKQLHSFAFCMYQLLIIVSNLKIDTIYLMIIFIVLSPPCYWYLNKLPQPKQQPQNAQQNIKQNKSIVLQSSSQQSN